MSKRKPRKYIVIASPMKPLSKAERAENQRAIKAFCRKMNNLLARSNAEMVLEALIAAQPAPRPAREKGRRK